MARRPVDEIEASAGCVREQSWFCAATWLGDVEAHIRRYHTTIGVGAGISESSFRSVPNGSSHCAKPGTLSRELVEPADDGSIDQVRRDRYGGRPGAVVQCEESGWLQATVRGRTVVLAHHPRMESGNERHADGEDEQRVRSEERRVGKEGRDRWSQD